MAEHQDLESLGKPLRDLRRAFEDLTEPHRPSLWRYCLRLTGSPWDAEDLVQETLMKAFARLTLFWQPLDPRAYLFRIASNEWIDGLRRVGPADTLAAMEELVTRLPPRQRVVLLLSDDFRFRAAEVAAMIGSKEGAVKAALHRARSALRRQARDDAPHGAGTVAARYPVPPPHAVVAQYLAAFNRRDPDAIAALLSPVATTGVVGRGEEHGPEFIRKCSLADWAADPRPQWAELAEVAGREAVLVFYRTQDHDRALSWLITLHVAGDRIAGIKGYYFCPDLTRFAAGLLGVPAVTHGYR